MQKGYVRAGLAVAVAGVTLLLADAWLGEKYFFEVKRYRIGQKESSKKVRIVLLTDLHFKEKFFFFHQKLVRKINALRPDLILIAGDLIDEHGQPQPAMKFFQSLDVSVPLIAIPGNHDNKNEVSRQTLRRIVEQHNRRLLVNETVQVKVDDTTLTVTGLDDFIEGESCLAAAVNSTEKAEHHLFLLHSPLQQENVLKQLQEINATRTTDKQLTPQYIFSGHTHGGQIRVGSFVPVLPEGAGHYVNGWYNNKKPYLYVSKGFGTSAVPFRLGSRAEITLFEYGV